MHICDYGMVVVVMEGGWRNVNISAFLSFMPVYQNSRAIYIRAILLNCIIQATNSYSLAWKGTYLITTNL